MAKTRKSKGSPPDRMTTRDLIDGCRHEEWTAAAAIFVLHGITPPDSAIEDAELAARFPEARAYVRASVRARKIGRKVSTQNGPRWVDTPARWYAWAKDRRLDLDPRVGKHFDAVSKKRHKGPKNPVHYLSVRKLLMDRLGATPEEIALWIFAGELKAWTTRDTGLERFWLQWFEGWSYDYVSQITDTRFSREQIETFQPKERFLTYRQLIDRWSPFVTEKEANEIIVARYGSEELWPLHPFAALATLSEPPPIAERVFLLSEIEPIEKQIGLKSAADVPQLSEAVLVKPKALPRKGTSASTRAIQRAVEDYVLRNSQLPGSRDILDAIAASREEYHFVQLTENKLTWKGTRSNYRQTYKAFENQVSFARKRWIDLNPRLADR